MSKDEELIRFVEANSRLEGKIITEDERQSLLDCLSGKKSFEEEIERTISHYKKLAD